MTWARLRLTLSEGSWLADVSRAEPESTLRVTALTPDGDVGYALVALVGPDSDTVAADVADHEFVRNVEVIGRTSRETTVQVTGRTPSFVLAGQRVGLPIELPVEVVEGATTLEVAGAHERVSRLTNELTAVGVACDVECVSRYEERARVLTDSQRELVFDAIAAGYYDAPRRCTQTELAERRGIAKSTCSEKLQRAEDRILKWFAEGINYDTETRERGKRTLIA